MLNSVYLDSLDVPMIETTVDRQYSLWGPANRSNASGQMATRGRNGSFYLYIYPTKVNGRVVNQPPLIEKPIRKP